MASGGSLDPVGSSEDPVSQGTVVKCGADITDDLCEKLAKLIQIISRPPPKLPYIPGEGGPGGSGFRGGIALANLGPDLKATFISRAAQMVNEGGALDYKNNNNGLAKAGGCQINCDDSVQLCVSCVADDVPGNIAFGFLAAFLAGSTGTALATIISELINRKLYGKSDSPSDREALKTGGKAAKALKGDTAADIKSAICDNLSLAVNYVDCPLCK